MGIAAYNRGTQVIRIQVSQDVDANRAVFERRSERQMIRDLQQQVLIERDRAEKAIRYMNLARAERDYLKATQKTARDVIARLKACVSGVPLASRLMALWTEMNRIESGE